MKEKGRTRWRRDRQEWRIGRSKKKVENKREFEGTGGRGGHRYTSDEKRGRRGR